MDNSNTMCKHFSFTLTSMWPLRQKLLLTQRRPPPPVFLISYRVFCLVWVSHSAKPQRSQQEKGKLMQTVGNIKAAAQPLCRHGVTGGTLQGRTLKVEPKPWQTLRFPPSLVPDSQLIHRYDEKWQKKVFCAVLSMKVSGVFVCFGGISGKSPDTLVFLWLQSPGFRGFFFFFYSF